MANPFVHVELNTADVAKAKSFYRELFDWQLEDMPMAEVSYTMIKVGEGTGGGVMKHPISASSSIGQSPAAVDLGATCHRSQRAVVPCAFVAELPQSTIV